MSTIVKFFYQTSKNITTLSGGKTITLLPKILDNSKNIYCGEIDIRKIEFNTGYYPYYLKLDKKVKYIPVKKIN